MKNKLQKPDRLVCVDDARFDAHEADGPHPECPERLTAVRGALASAVPPDRRRDLAPRPATDEELLRAHTEEHLVSLRESLQTSRGYIDGDTFFSPGSEKAAWLAAGAAAQLASDMAQSQAPHIGVLAARPPGHHATRDRAMGFCLLNNVAVAAHAALAAGSERVAIVDWDVHHGNGTQDIFYDDGRVLFISLHQWPLYPGSGRPSEIGRGDGLGSTVNLALPAGSDGAVYGDAFRQVVLPALEAFDPEVLLVSSGFDAHAADPLANMALRATDYGAMAHALWEQACERGQSRLGLMLEGGYDLAALQASADAALKGLQGNAQPLHQAPIDPRAQQAIDATRGALSGYLGM